MKELFGGLVNFDTPVKLVECARTMDDKMSVKIIEASLEYGVKDGLYTLEEAYLLYEALRRVKTDVD
jgi:hypothetical protein